MNFSQLPLARRALGALSALVFLTAFLFLAFVFQQRPNTPEHFASTFNSQSNNHVFTAPGLPTPNAAPNSTQPVAPAPSGSTPSAQLPPPMPLPPGQALPGAQLPPMPLPPGAAPTNLPGNPKLAILFQKAVDAQRKGDLKSAAASYRELLRENPETMSAHLNLALILLQQKNDKQATWHLKKAIAIAPTAPQPRMLLAQSFIQQKKPREAYEQWSQLAELKLPDGGQAAFAAGAIAFEELKKPADAERWLRRANEQSKGADPRVALLLAKALSAQKKYMQANAALEPLAKKYPKTIEIQSALADAQWQSGQKSKAISTLRALEKNTSAEENKGTNLGQVRLMLARALAGQHEYSQAAATLQKALDTLPAQSPIIAPAKTLLAQTFAAQAEASEKNGKVEEALVAWNKAGKLFPDNPTAFAQRGRLLAKQNKNSEALLEYNRALKLLPRDGSLLEAAAKLEEKTGDSNRALTHWKTLLETRSDYAPAYFNLARIAANQKQFAAQMDYLETRLSKNPDLRAPYDAVLEAGRNANRAELARDWVAQMAKKYPKAQAPRNALIAFERKHPPDKSANSPESKAPAPKLTPTPAPKPTPQPNASPQPTSTPAATTPTPSISKPAPPALSTPTVKTSPKITPPVFDKTVPEKTAPIGDEDVENTS